MNFTQNLRTILLALILSIGVSYAYAAWLPPTQTPPLGNIDVPVNVGTTYQSKTGGFDVANTLSAINGIFTGNVGIGVVSPIDALHINGAVRSSGSAANYNSGDQVTLDWNAGNARLNAQKNSGGSATLQLMTQGTSRIFINDSGNVDIAGAIKIGDTSTCTAGTIRFRSNDFEGCVDGTTWKSLTAAGGGSPPSSPAPYTTAGTYTLTIPSSGVSSMTITAAGGGGGGGGGGGSDGSMNGDGGGGGGQGQITTITSAVAAGDVYTINVGDGGNGGEGGYENSGFGHPDGNTGQGGFASSAVKNSTGSIIVSVTGGGGGPGGANSGGSTVGSKGADCIPYGAGGDGGGGIWDPGKPGGTCSGGGGGGSGATSVNKQGATGGKGGAGIVTVTW